jgi:hypothetical protein
MKMEGRAGEPSDCFTDFYSQIDMTKETYMDITHLLVWPGKHDNHDNHEISITCIC